MLTSLLISFTQSPHLSVLPLLFLASLIVVDITARLIAWRRALPSKLVQPAFFSDPRPPQGVDYIGRVSFATRPLMQDQDATLLASLQQALIQSHRDHHALAQVNLLDVLQVETKSALRNDLTFAQRSLRGKRLEFAVLDPDHKLCLAILYLPQSRYRKTGSTGNQGMNQALANAGVPVLQLPRTCSPATLRAKVLEILGPGSERIDPQFSSPVLQVVSA